MAELPLNKPAGVLVKTTGVDYPGIIAGSFFLKGCNLRCPYCYNTELVLGGNNNTSLNTIEDLFSHLEKRQGILKGLVVSGGEPLLNPYTPLIITKAKSLGYKIKLDTNGTLPDRLKFFVDSEELRPDFIAMDLKTSPAKYMKMLTHTPDKHTDQNDYFISAISKSIELIKDYPSTNREWRTVLVPPLITKDDIKILAEFLPKDASWQFAQFRNENCLDASYNEIYPYSDTEVNDLIEYAKTLIPGAELR